MPDINLDFDPARAKRLKPGDDDITFAQAPGLRMQASKTGRRWVYRYRSPIDNALRQIKLGAWPALPAHRAVVEWEKRKGERDAGRDPALERKAATKLIRDEPRPQSVAKVLAVYLDALAKINPRKKAPRRTEHGRNEVKRMFDFDLGALAKRNAVDITPRDAARLLTSVRDRAPNTALRLRRELAAAWRTARAHGLLPPDAPNPWPDALLGELAQGERDRKLTPGEIRSLMRFLPNYTPSVADALELTLRTGLRSGEVVALCPEWFEEIDKVLWLEVPAEHMKMRRVHRVPIVGRARAIVEARQDGGEFLFPSPLPDRHIEQKALGVAVHFHSPSSETRPTIERRRCPVDEWAPHDLRRTAATLLGDLGCPFEVIEAILAHKLPGVSGTYNRSEYAEQKFHWLTKLNEHIDAIAASETLRQMPRRKAAA